MTLRPSKQGFDIVIGNPPYGAKLSNEDKRYIKDSYISAKTIANVQKGSLDTFTLFIELGYNLTAKGGINYFIVPLSITASDAMSGIHKLLMGNCDTIKISSYGDRPKRIFESAEQQVSIIGFRSSHSEAKHLLTTSINKRYANDSIWKLLDNLHFVDAKEYITSGRIPKIGTNTEQSVLSEIYSIKTRLADLMQQKGKPIYYRKAGGRYYKVVTKTATGSSAEGCIIVSKKYQDLVGACLSSTLFYWFWLINSDWHNLRSSELRIFPIPYDKFNEESLGRLSSIYDVYLTDLEKNSKIMSSGLKCYYARKSKTIIDQIDDLICPLYGLTLEEIKFIKNYEIEFRLSDEE